MLKQARQEEDKKHVVGTHCAARDTRSAVSVNSLTDRPSMSCELHILCFHTRTQTCNRSMSCSHCLQSLAFRESLREERNFRRRLRTFLSFECA